jgi:hypothetical protein
MLCWELGGGMGHIANLLPLAEALGNLGVEVVWAVSDVCAVPANIAAKSGVFQAPMLRQAGAGLPPICYPEMILGYGYANAENLLALTRAWVNLASNVKPDLMVCDYAPTAMLTGRILSIPVAALGTGFLVPPREAPMPNFRVWEQDDPTRRVVSERQVLDAINAVLRDYGTAPIQNFYQLFDVWETFLITFAELDHYGIRVKQKYWGPAVDSGKKGIAEWPDIKSEGQKIFAYLKASENLEAVVQTIANEAASAVVVVPDLPNIRLQRLRQSHIALYDKPVDMAEALKTADLVVCNAGAATVNQSLLAGRPVVNLPLTAEQYLFALCVAATGAGCVFAPPFTTASLGSVIRDAASASTRAKAMAFAAAKSDFAVADSAHNMAMRCIEAVR